MQCDLNSRVHLYHSAIRPRNTHEDDTHLRVSFREVQIVVVGGSYENDTGQDLMDHNMQWPIATFTLSVISGITNVTCSDCIVFFWGQQVL